MASAREIAERHGFEVIADGHFYNEKHELFLSGGVSGESVTVRDSEEEILDGVADFLTPYEIYVVEKETEKCVAVFVGEDERSCTQMAFALYLHDRKRFDRLETFRKATRAYREDLPEIHVVATSQFPKEIARFNLRPQEVVYTSKRLAEEGVSYFLVREIDLFVSLYVDLRTVPTQETTFSYLHGREAAEYLLSRIAREREEE